jgi:hypothetical protein
MDAMRPQAPPEVDSTKPSVGRLYDYYLNGRYHFQVDRDAAERIRAKIPEVHYMAHANRGFLQRAAGFMARAGLRQFIDIGAGLPTQWNSHEVVHTVDPDAVVVYVDNDPGVLAESTAMLAARGEKNAIYVAGDIREPASILDSAEVRALIDFTQPVAYIHAAVWHFVPPEADPHGLMRQYIGAVPSGSYVALSHVTADGQQPEKVQNFLDVYASSNANLAFRTIPEIKQLFDGLDFEPPYEGARSGLSFCDLWGSKNPDGVRTEPSHTWLAAGVARKA